MFIIEIGKQVKFIRRLGSKEFHAFFDYPVVSVCVLNRFDEIACVHIIRTCCQECERKRENNKRNIEEHQNLTWCDITILTALERQQLFSRDLVQSKLLYMAMEKEREKERKTAEENMEKNQQQKQQLNADHNTPSDRKSYIAKASWPRCQWSVWFKCIHWTRVVTVRSTSN